jgi:nitrate/nitrite transport system substrate-binding protein
MSVFKKVTSANVTMSVDRCVADSTQAQISSPPSAMRRSMVKAAGAATVMSLVSPLVRQGAWAQGSDAPELKEVKVGFIPLTDCASVVMASILKLDEKYGIKIVLSKESSWASIRDKLVNGELDAAHVLYGLVYGVHLGVGGPKKDMAVLMTLNNNGQAITLSNQLKDKGVSSGETLAALMRKEKREYTFAQTFPTGTHAMWLYYWLAAHGINPLADAKVITVPPPQMVANMRVGNMDGYCVGEPWNARAVFDKIGFTAATTQDIWTDHPEKVLGTTNEWTKKNPNTARALVAAIIEASRYIDQEVDKKKTATILADKAHVNTTMEVIEDRWEGKYDNGLGKKWTDTNAMKFYRDGAVNFPYLSDGMWFLTQHKRWGLLKEHPDYVGVAKAINKIEIYKKAATAAKAAIPKSEMRSSKLLDGVVWDGSNPKAYADSFKVKV